MTGETPQPNRALEYMQTFTVCGDAFRANPAAVVDLPDGRSVLAGRAVVYTSHTANAEAHTASVVVMRQPVGKGVVYDVRRRFLNVHGVPLDDVPEARSVYRTSYKEPDYANRSPAVEAITRSLVSEAAYHSLYSQMAAGDFMKEPETPAVPPAERPGFWRRLAALGSAALREYGKMTSPWIG